MHETGELLVQARQALQAVKATIEEHRAVTDKLVGARIQFTRKCHWGPAVGRTGVIKGAHLGERLTIECLVDRVDGKGHMCWHIWCGLDGVEPIGGMLQVVNGGKA